MIADPIERLRAANPEPSCPPPPIEEVWRRIESQGRAAPKRVAGLTTALASVGVVIAVSAVVLLSHGRPTVAAGSGGARQLIAKLAVLRRPQTAADRLPAGLHVKSPLSPPARIIPRFTRLVRTLPGARLYLVVTTWNADSTWSERLGDQVSIVSVHGSHASGTVPVPAADLTNADEVSLFDPTRTQLFGAHGLYYAGIVPDGVARVRWTFANNQYLAGAVINATAANNVAVAAPRADTAPPVLRAAWYAPDGRRVPTSDRALLAAQAARDAAQKAQAIRLDLRSASRADPSLLAAFAVFDITSRTGVRTAAGDIISRPPLSSLPLFIVQDADWQRFELDPTQVRRVVTPAGAQAYVIPGRDGLCLEGGPSRSPFPDGFLSGGGGGSCNLLPGVATQGIFMTIGSLNVTTTYRLVPKTIRSITVRTGRGTRATIPVPDGIYISASRRTANVRPCRPLRATRPGVPYRCIRSPAG